MLRAASSRTVLRAGGRSGAGGWGHRALPPSRCSMRSAHYVVALSGGVDSSVAAHLLLSAGHEVSGLYMHNWDGNEETGECPGEADRRSAQRVAKQLNIPFHEVSLVRDYWTEVWEPFLDGTSPRSPSLSLSLSFSQCLPYNITLLQLLLLLPLLLRLPLLLLQPIQED